ncbi:phenylalanine--tRNA ligase subunit beta [uncultured Dialister sp.]|jgi:phenylalanyl-tRNA synthetase beta chain|uniref:phenylalanine--tRNA ligase subunit beta n=1 Tax=uncultured Dialister sp. TaxID=278064 RepID=UPI0025E084E0|nr:phenylalanine--tRNA ligase subunit beta [uncultured Dialister sp.]
MNVSLKWLSTLVDITGMNPDDMAETLTVDGIPVEHVIRPGSGIKGVVTGKILSVEKHPDADHLLICQLDVGEEEPVQIVTSASNVKVGQIVPCALHGAHVPAAHDNKAPGGLRYGDIKIKAGKLRGVKSAGMMCSLGELGMDDNLFPSLNKEGILILPEDTPVGEDIHKLYDLDDVVYEMELTANRADCFSMIGMALETGAIFRRKVTLPKIRVKEEGAPIEGRASVHIDNPKFCKRFCGRLLENVKIGRSPEWIENRLRSNGIRPINNVVDAANYVMLEIGQPLHTYDYDKVAGHSLTCRFAHEGETMVTLDGQERDLTPADLVIADGDDKAACVAGVMGGLDSEVTENTKNVLLEAAVFDSASIRRTSRRLGLRSEASGRYEKGINPARTEMAINRICQILEDEGAATTAKGMLDEYPVKAEPQIIKTTVDKINKYIGISMPKDQMIQILEDLYFKVDEDNGNLTVTVPEFRLDLEGMPDLAEEVARVYGYKNIPITTPWSAIAKGAMTTDQDAIFRVTDALVADGLSEVVNYSFMDPKDLEKLNFPWGHKVYNAIPIMNPISEEYPDMRTTLLPGLMHTLVYNLSQKNDEVAVFESGHVYQPKELPLKELPYEYLLFSGLLCGSPEEAGYPNKGRKYDFFDVKAIMEDVLSALGVRDYEIRRSTYPVFHPGISADFVKDGKVLMSFGQLHPAVLDKWDIKREVYGFVIFMPHVMSIMDETIDYTRIPKFPASTRDLSLLVPAKLTNDEVEAIIRKAGGKHLELLRLFDLYQGEQVKEGYKSMAYNLTFRAEDRTLTDKEVDGWIENIVKALDKEGITLRA